MKIRNIIIALEIAFAVFSIISYWWRQHKITEKGTETVAVISKIEEESLSAPSCGYYYVNYVTFTKNDGKEREAKLINESRRMFKGDRVRIRYLPEKDNVAVLISVIGPVDSWSGCYK